MFLYVNAHESLANVITRDPSGLLKLSESQLSMLDGWKRPNEVYAGSDTIAPKEGSILDLAQDVITDCSVVASLCSAISREERFAGKVPSPTTSTWFGLGRSVKLRETLS